MKAHILKLSLLFTVLVKGKYTHLEFETFPIQILVCW